jgi:uncharacterized membrane protein
MFLAEEAATSAGTFATFDIFMIIFTIVIAISVFRLAKSKERNNFALGFASICLLVFLAADFLMFLSWIGQLHNFQAAIFG